MCIAGYCLHFSFKNIDSGSTHTHERVVYISRADILKNIDRMADDYTRDVYKMPREKRGEMVKKIETLFEKSREYGDDKVQLAMQTYEMVSGHRGVGGGRGSMRPWVIQSTWWIHSSETVRRSMRLFVILRCFGVFTVQ